jgi:methyl-accepting chemotaxis protein
MAGGFSVKSIKNMSMKMRLLVASTLIIFMTSAIMIFLTYRTQMGQLRDSFNDAAKNDSNLFASQIKGEEDGLYRALAGFTRMDSLLRPFAEKKKDELLSVAKPIFEDIKVKNNITHMYFIEPDGVIFMRVHKPEQTGDRIARATYKKAAETKKFSSGIEMGKNFFSLRSVHPVSYKGAPIGFMEVAQEIDHVFKVMKDITGADYSVFLSDEFIQKKSADVKNEKAGAFTLLDATNKDIILKLARKANIASGTKGFAVEQISLDKSRYIVGIGPLRDATGETVGVLFSARDVTALHADILKSIVKNLLMLALVLAVSGSIFCAMVMADLWTSMNLFNHIKDTLVNISSTWDITQRIHTAKKGEAGELAESLNHFLDKFSEVIKQIRSVSDKLSSEAESFSASAVRIAQGASTQSDRASQVATSSEEMSQTVMDVAKNASNIAGSSNDTAKTAKEGESVVNKTIDEVQEIARTISDSARRITSLGERSKQIGEIVSVIKDIADQTNLLALNAAIEAARAGDQGRGFAVVADEVRKLAERTAKATTEISEMIAAIQHETDEAVASMGEGSKIMDEGVSFSTQAGGALHKIVESVNSLQSMVQQIASATEEMSAVSEHISSDIAVIASISKDTSSGIDRIKEASAEMAGLSASLKNMVSQFKI